jgi:hypothetical protein
MKWKMILVETAVIASITSLSIPGIVFADPQHCDRRGWPSCYEAGREAAISGTSCPSGHSANFCRGWEAASGSFGGGSNDNRGGGNFGNDGGQSHTSSDWTLTVRPVNINFGDTNIHIRIKGPFGAYRDDTIANSQDPIDTFSMTGSDFPSGYRYQVCISSTAIGFFLPHCQYFTHEDGDETVTISPD